MPGVLQRSRIPLRLVPRAFIEEAAREESVTPEELDAAVTPDLRRALDRAVRRWRAAAPAWTRLDFTMQHQQELQWCWAAVSVSVSLHYDPQGDWTQCRMAGSELDRDCCRDGSSSACDRPHPLDPALSRAGVLERMERGSVAFEAVRQEIDAGRPLAWRIGWRLGGGHFAVIEACGMPSGPWVAVDDPKFGRSDCTIATLTDGDYLGSGRWTHTYFTRPAPGSDGGDR